MSGQEEQRVTVFVVNAVRTSAGHGPGPRRLPFAEAAQLLRDHHAVGGDKPPRGWAGEVVPPGRMISAKVDDGLRH